jgi:polyvinyl alcohol dehydrogenase (cytochrome)
VRLLVEVLEDRTVPSGVDVVPGDPNDWPMFGHDPQGARYNQAEYQLGPNNVSQLQELWRFETIGAVSGTPAVVNNVVYAGDISGTVHALTSDGELLWQTTLDVPSVINPKIYASPLVTNRTVVIGDMAGQIHGLDVATGEVRWTTRPPNPGPIFGDQHLFQMIMGAGTMVGNHVAFGVSSLENFFGPLSDPNYPDFTFRGNVVLLDPADGSIVWQTFFVDEATLQPDGSYGPNGATVWGSPAYDRASNTIFVGTGQHYGPPTTATSDALIALDAATGAIKWVSQMTPNDTWNITFGLPSDNDLDIGDSPQLYRLNGRLVVAAGQKSGVFHVVDAETGEAITPPRQYLPPGGLGGFHIDSAVANGVNYAPGNSWGFVLSPPTPADAGAVFAISGDGSTQLWKFDTDSPILGGVAVANGVVYVQDVGGNFYAIDAATGQELATLVTGTPVQGSGPAISRGQIYVGTGDFLTPLLVPFPLLTPGSIVALGLPDKHHPAAAQAVPIALASSTALSRSFEGHGSGDLIAAGIATDLAALTHQGTLVNAPTDAPVSFAGSGRTTSVAANGDEVDVLLSGTDAWDGGTGRFTDASDIVDLSGQLFPDESFVFTLEGVLDFQEQALERIALPGQ